MVVASTLLDPDERAQTIRLLASVYARNKPAEASAWSLERATTSPEFEDSLSGSVKIWMTADSEAASRWASSLPIGRTRDIAALAVVEAISSKDTDGAKHWAKDIRDAALRQKAFDTIERNKPPL